MEETKVEHMVGKKKAFDVVKSESWGSTSFDVRDSDTGKHITRTRSRKEATEKAQKLADEN